MENRAEIQELTLEEVMGDRFGRYSKYIIQERALPDIRDGLKPVQRRILYAMNVEGNTSEKGFRKSAKTVGNVIGNYHPHGDSSVYEAMVRMSQDWKMKQPLVEMHGNNGSMDGDSPAAMRYTEARLAKISSELVKDIDKETVDFVLNFDDTTHEPVVLPANYPNLLINGATGISAGYATDIPPHNLAEVIDATVHLIDHPKATTEDLMNYVKGPDFPTGGIIQGLKGLQNAYETGKGKIVVRCQSTIETLRGGKQQIVVTEVPYELNKASLVRKLDEVRVNKKIDGIAEVRDESDRSGLRVVIELKKESNAEGILTYLLKNTDLQVSYNFNMVAISDKRPEQVGLRKILEAYIKFKKEVVTKRTQFELMKARRRQHIVEGLIKAISILDEVIATIRQSKNKQDAKENIIRSYDFTEVQAEAIVSLQLYRLTNTDITQLQQESNELSKKVEEMLAILNDVKILNKLMKKELNNVKKNYAVERMTEIEKEIEELNVDTEVLITQEDTIVSVTKEGYIKRTSLRSYGASSPEEIGVKESDHPLFVKQLTTLDQMIIFTNKGNVINRPVHEIPDVRWKDMGHHLSQSIRLAPDEKVIAAYGLTEFLDKNRFVFVTKNGYIKQTVAAEFEPKRSYKKKSFTAMKLKNKADEVVRVIYLEDKQEPDIFLISNRGFGLRYTMSEVPIVGAKAAGVKSMNLKPGDFVVNGVTIYPEDSRTDILIVTHRGAVKKMNIQDFSPLSRAQRGLLVLRQLKTKSHQVTLMKKVAADETYTIVTDKDKKFEIDVNNYSSVDRYNNGSFVLDEKEDGQPIELIPLRVVFDPIDEKKE
ncbi:DNA topoisomerase IV subunit A [Lacticigenium naphthae]|uniref:DNA topoisomerase IV subunit A n=1 Tax=Lacticigenium naphthae TaxID=515351 RepID=UPI0003F82C21|nr:DNA topoisomerase IV subunit A [Lacticigenium naphthae]